MITLVRMDAAFRRLEEYDPDLDVSLLIKDGATLEGAAQNEFLAKTRVVRMTLVARIADIVKQASNEPVALDAAIAMAEVLISTCGGRGEYPCRGHKHAMQAIQLLASVYSRLDYIMDLFFDLVERFCAQSRSQGTMQTSMATSTDAPAIRVIQNYDQTLLKLLSKHWYASGPKGTWDIGRPMQRIRDLQDVYESEGSKGSVISRFKRKDTDSKLFCESYKFLRKVQKQRVAEVLSVTCNGSWWTPQVHRIRRSRSNGCLDTSSQDGSSVYTRDSRSTASRSLSSTPRTVVSDFEEQSANYTHTRGVVKVDSLVDLKTDLRLLCAVTENSERGNIPRVAAVPAFSAFDFDLDRQVPLDYDAIP